jgi:hypothetical protein
MMMYRRSVRKIILAVEMPHLYGIKESTDCSWDRHGLTSNRAIPIILTPLRLGIDQGGQKNRAIDELRTLIYSLDNDLPFQMHDLIESKLE